MKILYLGTDPGVRDVIHYPVIKIVPLEIPKMDWSAFTHVIFTSKNAVRLFPSQDIKTVIAIGRATAGSLERVDYIAENETQEGIIELFKKIDLISSRALRDAHILYPRSTRSRPVLVDFFEKEQIRYKALDLYETHFQKPLPLPDLSEIEEIIFTSPSTVHAFFQIFSAVPSRIKLTSIGPITELTLRTEERYSG